MIGRGALGRPWLFRSIARYLETGELLPEPAPEQIRDTLLCHLEALYGLYGNARGLRIARKHIAWYSRGLAAAADEQPRLQKLLARINRIDTTTRQINEVRALFDEQQRGEMAA
jgi:tRNA-dihydrouridine synthase B